MSQFLIFFIQRRQHRAPSKNSITTQVQVMMRNVSPLYGVTTVVRLIHVNGRIANERL